MKPTLLVLAAGLGSRYGSLKQVDSFGPSGETIIEYSIFDALRAGFGKVVFVISREMEEDFNRSYKKKFPRGMDIEYCIQDLSDIPSGYKVPEDRKKPWGTGHAVLAAKSLVTESFAVINGDDFYGIDAYRDAFRFLFSLNEREFNQYCLLGYELEKTLSKHGLVSRGVCKLDVNDYLTELTERTKIGYRDNGIGYIGDNQVVHYLEPDTMVSMNMFGFTPTIFDYLEEYFEEFIEQNFENPKAEFYLPYVINRIIQGGYGKVKVLRTNAEWFGVTYKEDKPVVMEKLEHLAKVGSYPRNLWK
jgi:NDP-sugar pyrophosphorylase family protein